MKERWDSKFDGGPGKIQSLNSMTEFTQVECGNKHTLLLNNRGMVFSFGNGLFGQLGTDKRPICADNPEQLYFPLKGGLNEPVIKISAKCNNSSAITDKGALFVWGDGKSGKLMDGQNKID
jgi:alpha-tubulin suppressor-like RCC1 family protein